MDENKFINKEPIAIVGISSLFPGATNAWEFWHNILWAKDLISDLPEHYWLIQDYYDPDPLKKGKTYAKRGGFLPLVDFNPEEFRLPPATLSSTDTVQLLSLIYAKHLLKSCPSVQSGKVDKKRISVILGGTSATEMMVLMGGQIQYPNWRKAMRESKIPESLIEEVLERVFKTYPDWTENSFPGSLGNVTAGRIANRLDLGGTNCVVDAACASSLAAIYASIQELQLGNSDFVITGGADAHNNIFAFMCFSKTPALSPTGDCRPFSQKADGTLLGEGVGLLALRRLRDAQKDNDPIYAVIRGVGTSSDGLGKSIYAPLARGQALAIKRAYDNSGISPFDIELIEAHGTATRANDDAEFKGLCNVFDSNNTTDLQWCALGSVKSQIGHTKAAAGAASMIKTALALHHKVLPPTIKVEKPSPRLDFKNSPFYLNTQTRPWIHDPDSPRFAGVSAFGFGGSNFHIVLEEYKGIDNLPCRCQTSPVNLLVVSAGDYDSFITAIAFLKKEVKKDTSLAVLAKRSQEAFDPDKEFRLAIIAENLDDLYDLLKKAEKRIEDDPDSDFSLTNHIHFSRSAKKSKMAFLFPGQGSQYLNMGKDLAVEFEAVRQTWDQVSVLDGIGLKGLHKKVFPIPVFDEKELKAQEEELCKTQNAQPGIGAVGLSMLSLLLKAGIVPDCSGGHSYGEILALFCGNVISSAKDLIMISQARGRLMDEVFSLVKPGGMTAVMAPMEKIRQMIEDSNIDCPSNSETGIVIANENSPDQVVLSGSLEELCKIEVRLKDEGLRFQRLPVSAAFHSRYVSTVADRFNEVLKAYDFKKPQIPVYTNTTGSKYPDDPDKIQKILARQLAQPVCFKDQIEKMYQDGVRVFLEIGPGSVLTRLVERCLKGREFVAAPIDQKGKNGLISFWNLMGVICVNGFSIAFENLWDRFNLENFAHYNGKASGKPSSMTVKIDGSNYGKPYPPKGGARELPDPVDASEYDFIKASKAAIKKISQNEKMTDQDDPVDTKAHSGSRIKVQEDQAGIPADSMDEVSFKKVMLEIVSEKTGYPEDILDFDTDLESGFGIDSIKKVEILAEFEDRFPDLKLGDIQELYVLRTLQEVIDHVKSYTGIRPDSLIPDNPSPGNEKADKEQSEAIHENLDHEIKRHLVKLIIEPGDGQAQPGLEKIDTLYIIADNKGVAPILCDKLNANGIHSRVVDTLPQGAEGVLFLKGINKPFSLDNMDDAIELNRSAFEVARRCASGMRYKGGLFITVQDTNGDFNLSGKAGTRSWSGGIAALAKTASAEWPKASVKAIDIECTNRTPEQIAQALLDEFLSGGPGLEVGLKAEGKRVCVETFECEPIKEYMPFSDNIVVLVSGGAQGITAQCLLALADQSRLKFAILGRSQLEEEPEFTKGCETEIKIRQALAAENNRSSYNSSPRHLVAEAKRILAVRDMKKSIKGLEKKGSKVIYLEADVRREDDVFEAVEKVRDRWGKIGILIHGAGVISDNYIDQKELKEFDQVFSTKVQGFKHLLSATRDDPLSCICCFSSVVARWGNVRQADYSMANEILNKVCQTESEMRKDCCVVRAINWGPWEMGMVRPHHKHYFESKGYTLIPKSKGPALFLSEISDSNSNGSVEVLISGKIIPLNDPLTDSWRMHLKDYPWVKDHSPTFLIPVLPMMAELEMMCQACQALFPGKKITHIKVLESKQWAAFKNRELSGRTLVRKKDMAQAEIEFYVLDHGREGQSWQMAAKSNILFDTDYPRPLNAAIPELENKLMVPDPYSTGTLFHGTSFQLMGKLVQGDNGASCQVSCESKGVPYGIIHPGMLDAAIHCIPCHMIEQWYPKIGAKKIAFPLRLESLVLYDKFPEKGSVRVEARKLKVHQRYFPVIRFYIMQDDTLLASFNLTLMLLPKGPLADTQGASWKRFLSCQGHVEGISLCKGNDAGRVMKIDDAKFMDWLPGTLSMVYGISENTEYNDDFFDQIALREHAASHIKLHPSKVIIDKASGRCANLPFNDLFLKAVKQTDSISTTCSGPSEIDFSKVSDYWKHEMGVEKNLLFDIILAFAKKFVRRVVLEDPVQYLESQKRPGIYLSNHQTGVETLLLAILLGFLSRAPFYGITNKEQQTGLLGVLNYMADSFVTVKLPLHMMVFDQKKRESLHGILKEYARKAQEDNGCLYVATEGRRAFSAGHKVSQLSSVFIDFAIQHDIQIIPVRFSGGLPKDGKDNYFDFPYGFGQQDYYIGKHIEPGIFEKMGYAKRPQYLLDRINNLGPEPHRELPLGPDKQFMGRVANRVDNIDLSELGGIVMECLSQLNDPCPETREFLKRMDTRETDGLDSKSILFTMIEFLTTIKA